jgi:hypothetical protein
MSKFNFKAEVTGPSNDGYGYNIINVNTGNVEIVGWRVGSKEEVKKHADDFAHNAAIRLSHAKVNKF